MAENALTGRISRLRSTFVVTTRKCSRNSAQRFWNCASVAISVYFATPAANVVLLVSVLYCCHYQQPATKGKTLDANCRRRRHLAGAWQAGAWQPGLEKVMHTCHT